MITRMSGSWHVLSDSNGSFSLSTCIIKSPTFRTLSAARTNSDRESANSLVAPHCTRSRGRSWIQLVPDMWVLDMDLTPPPGFRVLQWGPSQILCFSLYGGLYPVSSTNLKRDLSFTLDSVTLSSNTSNNYFWNKTS